jgi:hypothetical protein
MNRNLTPFPFFSLSLLIQSWICPTISSFTTHIVFSFNFVFLIINIWLDLFLTNNDFNGWYLKTFIWEMILILNSRKNSFVSKDANYTKIYSIFTLEMWWLKAFLVSKYYYHKYSLILTLENSLRHYNNWLEQNFMTSKVILNRFFFNQKSFWFKTYLRFRLSTIVFFSD